MEKITKEKFEKLVSESRSITDLALKLGYKKYYDGKRLSGTAYRELRKKYFKFGLNYESLKRYKAVKDINKLELLDAVKTSVSIREVLGKLGFDKNHGSKYAAIKKIIDSFDINTDHFTGMLWSKGKTRFTDERINRQGKKTETPWDEAFAKGSSAKTRSLMKRLILSKKREYRCSICGINTWSDKPLRLRLDHIDGDCCNNEEDNLRLLCPNCDAQTDTFCRGKRAKNLTHKWWEDLTDLGVKIKSKSKSEFESKQKIKHDRKKIKYNRDRKTLKCKTCGDPTSENSKHTICRKCYLLSPINRKVSNRPPIEQLLEEIKELGYVGTGRKYGVSDNAIRKWLK